MGSDIRSDVVKLPDPVVSAGVDLAAAAAPEPRSPTDLSVLMARAMQHSLIQRGLKPPGDVANLTTSAQVAEFLEQAQQTSKNAAGAH
jgi:hypothetical protein